MSKSRASERGLLVPGVWVVTHERPWPANSLVVEVRAAPTPVSRRPFRGPLFSNMPAGDRDDMVVRPVALPPQEHPPYGLR